MVLDKKVFGAVLVYQTGYYSKFLCTKIKVLDFLIIFKSPNSINRDACDVREDHKAMIFSS